MSCDYHLLKNVLKSVLSPHTVAFFSFMFIKSFLKLMYSIF